MRRILLVILLLGGVVLGYGSALHGMVGTEGFSERFSEGFSHCSHGDAPTP